MKQTFTVIVESDRGIKSGVIHAVLAQDLTGVARNGSGIKVEEESYTALPLKVNRPRKQKK